MTKFEWRLWKIEARFYNLRIWWRYSILKCERSVHWIFPDVCNLSVITAKMHALRAKIDEPECRWENEGGYSI